MFNLLSSKMSFVLSIYGKRLLTLFFVLFMSVILGVIVCSSVPIVIGAAALVILAISIFLLLNLAKASVPCLLLSLALLQFFFFPLVYEVFGVPAYVLMQIYLMVVGVYFFKDLYSVVCEDKYLLFSFLMLIFYCSMLIVSTVMPTTYAKSYVSILYQLVAVIKPYLVLAFAFGMSKLYGDRVIDLLYCLGRWLWVPMLVLILVQFLVPNVFKIMFPFSVLNSEETGLFPSRALGIFESSAYLASFSSFYSIFFFSKAICTASKVKRFYDFFLAGVYWALVLFAIQRQELVALFITLLFLYVFYKKEYSIVRASTSLGLLVSGCIIFTLLFGNMSEKEFDSWGGNTYAAISHPRANLYDGAFKIAEDYFPVGSGLGSYAGAGSTKFNLELFYKMGFAKLWWFGDKKTDFLMDSYWANPIAESGYLGAIFLLFHYLLMFFSVMKKLLSSSSGQKHLWLISVGSFLYVLLTSATSPSFIEPRIIFFPFLAIAMAYGVRNKEGKQ